MSRVGITKEEVRQAIAQLRNQGSPVTVRSIQAITGGSYSTVQRFWKDCGFHGHLATHSISI
ncbi:DNA-binding protein [Pseudomonas aeruginosa]